ncbi:DNA-binding transcriptional regulator, XRE-family HTH domain [Flavobacterium fluvii]|uniref:DNA-binding transcriptional regulator, XRE-family HTH domain n=1 Tax=Flavobacterium fluvii TaxID=468056 RepID=A0A1M5FD74_9FLAO|nr:helix-turn-helix transcriptional regulator [Flavobacterium fluvii]SHF89436.1 DNA-binding transcriptional regulator, XRE-family HTH domain [Flavobacterium fluvii]
MNILRLKELMNEKGITGKELADKVEVTPASISNIVQGNSFPKPDLLIKIAGVLDVDVRDLFQSTKPNETETIFVFREGSYTPIGKLNK